MEPFILGAFFGPATIGLYRMVTRIVDLVTMLVTRPLWQVAFPYFSDTQDNQAELRRRLLVCLRVAVLTSWPILAVLAAESHTVLAAIGDRWQPAAPALVVLSLFGALHSLTLFTGPLLFATNRPGHVSILMAMVCVAMFGSMGALGFMLRGAEPEYQALATAYTRAGVHALVLVPVALYTMHVVAGVRSELLRCVLSGAAASAIAALTDLFLQSLPQPVAFPAILALAGRSLASLLVAMVFLWIRDRSLRALLFQARSSTSPSARPLSTSLWRLPP
jgi:O-antigen/teichoic acid export membrane protein